jgi:hypothetical protein
MLSALALGAIGAGPALADDIGQVLVNGAPATTCPGRGNVPPSSTAYCRARFIVGLDGPTSFGGGHRLDFYNESPSAANGNAITDVQITTVPGAPSAVEGEARSVGFFAQDLATGPGSAARDPRTVSPPLETCELGFTITLVCPVNTPVQPSAFGTLAYALHDQGRYPGGLATVNVIVNYGFIGACARRSGDPAMTSGQRGAVAAGGCTPPSNTRITEASIGRNTALFRFRARRATSFECQLFRDMQVMSRRACQSPKRYGTALPPGHYTFVVVGIDGAGIDVKPAFRKFTIG